MPEHKETAELDVEGKNGEAKHEMKDASPPRKWWQWFFIYPTLIVSLIGSFPTYFELFNSHLLGVPFGRSYDAKEQNRMWNDNFECAQKAAFALITTKQKVEIGTFVCESGDVLLHCKRPEWEKAQRRWVSWNEVAQSSNSKSANNFPIDLFGRAYAAEPDTIVLAQMSAPSVICQRWVGNGLLLQRIATPAGCFDQVINTYTGWVVSSMPAPCVPNC
jgi:hypothetical protein